VEIEGIVSEENNQIFFTTADGTKYLVKGGPFLEQLVGRKVMISGTILYADEHRKHDELVIQWVQASGYGNWFATLGDKLFFIGLLGGAAAAGAYAGYEGTRPPASR
jgi:hypothetical protein